jgi:hypothetical protein
MVKIVMLIKKRPDLTRAQFIDYYDRQHVPFMHKILSKGAAIHRRNFVIPDAADIGSADNLDAAKSDDYDAICEVFYEDRATAESVMQDFQNPETRRLCLEDEAKFVMPGSIKRYLVEVHETVFRPLPDRP